MIDSESLRQVIERELSETDLFLVDLKVSGDNDILVEIDSENPVDIEECEKLTRAIEKEFDREKEDYTLEVGSAGLTSPFKVVRQYKKYIGKEVEVLTKEGKKLSGLLREAGDDSFTILVTEKVKKPENKRPVIEELPYTFPYSEVKQTKYLLKF